MKGEWLWPMMPDRVSSSNKLSKGTRYLEGARDVIRTLPKAFIASDRDADVDSASGRTSNHTQVTSYCQDIHVESEAQGNGQGPPLFWKTVSSMSHNPGRGASAMAEIHPEQGLKQRCLCLAEWEHR